MRPAIFRAFLDTSTSHADPDLPLFRQVSRLKSAESVVAWPAGSLYPWKLVAHLLRASLAKGLNLQTFTRVESITAADKKGLWSVNTPRGSIVRLLPALAHSPASPRLSG